MAYPRAQRSSEQKRITIKKTLVFNDKLNESKKKQKNPTTTTTITKYLSLINLKKTTTLNSSESNIPPVFAGHSVHGLPQPLPTVLQQVSKETAPFIASSQRLLVILVQHLAVLVSVKKRHENNLTVYKANNFSFQEIDIFTKAHF